MATLAVLMMMFVLCSRCLASTEFSAWLKENDKRYDSQEEYRKRETVFNYNLRLIDELNQQHQQRGIVFSMNQFGDLTAEEFKTTILMTPRPTPPFRSSNYVQVHDLAQLPDSFDWREKGVVSEVKDQGSVGSCWAFSTVGNIEGQWALTGHNLVSLSAEQLVDCDSTSDPNNMNTDCGVFGGWPYLAYQYIQRAGGIESETSYPYCSGFGKCFPCMAPGYNKTRCGPPVPPKSCLHNESCLAKLDKSRFVEGLKVESWVAIPKNETAMMMELVSRGPLSIALNAVMLQFYHSGVWDPLLPCDPTELDHAVLLVGYGVKKELFGEKPYWLVKNSWGTKWGEKGYFMMIRGKDKCGIAQQVTSAVLA